MRCFCPFNHPLIGTMIIEKKTTKEIEFLKLDNQHNLWVNKYKHLKEKDLIKKQYKSLSIFKLCENCKINDCYYEIIQKYNYKTMEEYIERLIIRDVFDTKMELLNLFDKKTKEKISEVYINDLVFKEKNNNIFDFYNIAINHHYNYIKIYNNIELLV